MIVKRKVAKVFYVILSFSLLHNISASPASLLDNEWWTNAYDRPDAVFVQLGHEAVLSCIPATHFKDAVPQPPTFKWTDKQGEDIADGRAIQLSNGNLKIEYAEAKDGGKYTCTIKGKHSSATYEHHLIVYRIPTISYETILEFSARPICNKRNIISQTNKMSKDLCSGSDNLCKFMLTANCEKRTTTKLTGKEKVMRSVLRISIKQAAPLHEKDYPMCEVNCIKDAIYKSLNQDYTKIEQLITKEMRINSSQLNYLPQHLKRYQKAECSAGYKMYKHIFCLPCAPGYYSEGNNSECSPCKKNHYQQEWGMARCHRCPKNTSARTESASDKKQCQGVDTLHLDGAGVHVQVESKTMKMYAVIAAISVSVAFLFTSLALLIWHFKYRKIGKDSSKTRSSSLRTLDRSLLPLPKRHSQSYDSVGRGNSDLYTYARRSQQWKLPSAKDSRQLHAGSGLYEGVHEEISERDLHKTPSKTLTQVDTPTYITLQQRDCPFVKMALKDTPITPVQQMISSCSGAILTSLFVTPLDVVKVRIQAQGKALNNKEAFVYKDSLTNEIRCEVCCRTECLDVAACIRNGSTYNGVAGSIVKQPAEHMRRDMYAQPVRFNNTMDAFVKITRSEGVTALWSGFSPTLVMAIPATVVYFTAYDILKYRFGYKETDPSTKYIPALAGVCARTLATSLISPLELLRTKMQSERLTYRELHKALRITMQECGSATLLRGLGPSLLRDVPFSAVYWGGYEYLKAVQMRRAGNLHATPTVAQSFLAGAASGTFAAFTTTPFDVIKTHRQVELGQLEFCKGQQVTSTWKLIHRLYTQNGVSALFAGLTPRLVKITPACAIMITSYEYCKAFFRTRNAQAASARA